jgi:hypothetical protein
MRIKSTFIVVAVMMRWLITSGFSHPLIDSKGELVTSHSRDVW